MNHSQQLEQSLRNLSPSLGVLSIFGSRLSLQMRQDREYSVSVEFRLFPIIERHHLHICLIYAAIGNQTEGKVFFASAKCPRPPIALMYTFRGAIGTFEIRDARSAISRRDTLAHPVPCKQKTRYAVININIVLTLFYCIVFKTICS